MKMREAMVTGDDRHDLVGTVDGTTYVWPGDGAGRLGARQAIDVAPDSARKKVRASSYDWVVPTSNVPPSKFCSGRCRGTSRGSTPWM